MKITDVNAVALNATLEHVSKAGTYQVEKKGTILTTISTDEGITGCTYVGQGPSVVSEQKKICNITNGKLKAELIGEDPFMIDHLWMKMFRHALQGRDRGLTTLSISGIDVSLYDLVGKTVGVPVFKLLGGSRDKIPIVSVQYYEEHEDFSEQLEKSRRATSLAKKSGFCGLKLKVGALSVEQDIERVKTVRDEGGENFVIVTDANHAWTVEQAIKFGKGVEDLSVGYLEEPVLYYDEIRDLRKVKEFVNVPISACQGVNSRIDCMDFIIKGAVDMINPDISRIGGITEWVKIAHMAEYYGVKMTAHACIEATLQLFGGVSNTTWATQQTPWRDPFWSGGEIVKSPPKPSGGYIKLLDKPGMGYDINEKKIAKYLVK